MSFSQLSIGLILPDVMGTYGDRGNAFILAQRAALYGIDARIEHVTISDPVPESLDIYVLGGAEDFAQQLAVKHFRRYPGLTKASSRGAVVLTVCAGMQICGNWWETADGNRYDGLGIMDIITVPMTKRAIGEVVCKPNEMAFGAQVLEQISGFENHRGGSLLGPTAVPLGQVEYGIGNAVFLGNNYRNNYRSNSHDDSRYFGQELLGAEGVVQDSVYGTYLHGPFLARNPQCADFLLTQATKIMCTGQQIPFQQQLRAERIAAAQKRGSYLRIKEKLLRS